MANKKGVKIVTIAVIAVFVIFMGLSAVMYFVGGNPVATDEQITDTTGEIVTEVLVNTGE